MTVYFLSTFPISQVIHSYIIININITLHTAVL